MTPNSLTPREDSILGDRTVRTNSEQGVESAFFAVFSGDAPSKFCDTGDAVRG